MELDKKALRSVFLGVAGCIVLYWLLHETERIRIFLGWWWGILSPFLTGAVLAFVLNVPMRWFERRLKRVQKPGIRRGLAILLTLVSMVLVLLGVVYLLAPQIGKTADRLVSTLPAFFKRVQTGITGYLADHPELMEWLEANTDFEQIDWPSLIQQAASLVTESVATIVDRAIAAVVGLSTGIFNAVLSVVFALYGLSRKELLARQGRRILYAFLPERWCDEIIRVLRLSNSTFSCFISGQCLEAVILGCMFAVSMLVFRMPYIPLVSVVIAVTALVPIVGAFLGCFVGAFFILVDSPVQAFWFVVMFLILQQIENNLVYPRVVGTSIGLPGMWVLVAVAIGGELMGVAGMFLMIPVASVLYTLLREFTGRRVAERQIDADKLRDHPPELKSRFRETLARKREQKLLRQMKRLTEKHMHSHEKKEN